MKKEDKKKLEEMANAVPEKIKSVDCKRRLGFS